MGGEESKPSQGSSRSENKPRPPARTKKHPKDHGEVQLTPTSNNKLKITHAPQFLETIRTQYKPEKWPELGIKDLPQSIQPQPSSTTRVDHSYPGVNLFELTNAISGEFCQQLISTTESNSDGLGYKDIKQEYDETYRHCDRVVCMSEYVAKKLWNIIRPQLQKKDVFEVKPYGFGAAGVWKPIGINPCFRFTRYSEGHHFKPHKDGLFVLHDNYRSIYTVMLYLNDSFEGGTTKFYETDPLQKVSGDTEALLQVAPKVNLIPKTGTLVIFNHDALHEGLPITKGKKYVLRTDIIFQRISFALNDTLYFLNDPAFHKAEKHYQKSIVLKAEGKPEQSTKEYLKGLELQAKLCSIPRKELKGEDRKSVV